MSFPQPPRGGALPLLTAAALLAQACGSSTFGGGAKSPGRDKPAVNVNGKGKGPASGNDVGNGTKKGTKEKAGDAGAKGGDKATVPVTGDLCAGRTAPLRVFILDLKSGWFAGDGGDTFKDFVADSCGSKVDFVYAHVTREVVEGNITQKPDARRIMQCDLEDPAFHKEVPGVGIVPDVEGLCRLGDLSSFHQVWILGGSESDQADIPVDSPFFASIAQRVAERAAQAKPAGFFLGAGLGNTMHANALAPSLSPALAKSFVAAAARGESGLLPEPERMRTEYEQKPLVPGEVLTAGRFLSSHPLFAGLNALADYVPHSTETCTGDGIAKLESVRPLAMDACGQVSVAESSTKVGGRVLLEANMARFYVTKPAEWFNRIVNWLRGS